MRFRPAPIIIRFLMILVLTKLWKRIISTRFPVTKNLISRFENGITIWNNQLTLAFNGTDDNIAKFLSELAKCHLTKLTAVSNHKFH